MTIMLSAEGLGKSYGVKRLFEQGTLHIEDRDRIGLIGVNGSGKSTLLRVLGGVEPPDEGVVRLPDRVRVEYVPQEPPFNPEATVLAQVFDGPSPEMKLLREYDAALRELNEQPGDAALQRRLLELSGRMDAMNAWQLDSEAKRMLSLLGIDRLDARMGDLSGGQRKRVALAGALIRPCDLLLLDEPTNHLDPDAIEWLEHALAKMRTALLMITHDRYFLDRVTNRIVELDRGRLYTYDGNYSLFLEKKAERLEQEHASEQKRQNLLRRELAWIRRGAQARSTKQKARIDRFEQLQGAGPGAKADELELSLLSSRLGRKVIELRDVAFSFDGRPIVQAFDLLVQRGDRIGVIGPNGSGKSTLLRLIAGELPPDCGEIEHGTTVRIGFFAQENKDMNEALRVIEYIREAAETVRTEDGAVGAAQMLERFLFPPSSHGVRIDQLSGGEKRRLFLLRLLMEAPNVLLLDEPTNDLDIQTLSVLEDYLESFAGAVITVSHDRYFLDRTAERLLSFKGNGEVESYLGTYEAYRERLQKPSPSEEVPKPKSADSRIGQAEPSAAVNDKPVKFSFKEQREYEQIDGLIAETEEELARVAAAINECGSDYTRLQELTGKQTELQTLLDERLERWTYLNELAEEIERSRK